MQLLIDNSQLSVDNIQLSETISNCLADNSQLSKTISTYSTDNMQYIINETFNQNTLIDCKTLSDEQISNISKLKVNSFINMAANFDNDSLEYIINELSKIRKQK